MRVLVLGALERPGACGRGVEHLDRAVTLQRAGERGGDRADRHVRAEAPEPEQRRAAGWSVEAAARLELQGKLPGDRRRERPVASEQLDERPARKPEEGRVAHGLDRRGARRAGQERELPDRGAGPEDAESPLGAARARDDAESSANDHEEVLGGVPLPQEPVAGEDADGSCVDGEVVESVRVRAGEQRNGCQRRPRDVRRAHRSPPFPMDSESTPLSAGRKRQTPGRSRGRSCRPLESVLRACPNASRRRAAARASRLPRARSTGRARLGARHPTACARRAPERS